MPAKPSIIQQAFPQAKLPPVPQPSLSPSVTSPAPQEPSIYQPLTPEQFNAAKKAGFSAAQIIENEKKRKASSTTAAPQQEQPGFFKSIYNDVVTTLAAKPIARTAQALAGLTERGASALGFKDFANHIEQNLNKPQQVLGQTIQPQATGPGAENQALKETAGDALKSASYLFPYGKAAKGISTLAAPVLGAGKVAKFAGNVGSGAAGGYAADVGIKLNENKPVGEALTPGLGTAIGAALPIVPPALKGVGRLGGESLGLSTGAGYGAIKEAFNAASAGGERAKAFTDALRGKTGPENIVENAKESLGTIISNRSKAYQTQLEKVAADNTKSFDISPVQNKLDSMLGEFRVGKTADGVLDFSRSPGLGRYKADLDEIQEVLKNWGTKPGDRTVVGIDLLKQTLDDFRRGSADSRKFDSFVTALRNSAKDIIKDEPGYSKLVGDYAEQTDLIKDIQKALSLGDKAQTDTAFRKLTTALRTNNEFRQQLIKELDDASGGFLSSQVAGQQLSEALPRGLARPIEGFGAAGLALTGGVGILPLLSAAAFTSPRIVGEIVNALGLSKSVFTQLLDRLGASSAQFPGDAALDSNLAKNTKAYLKAHPPSLGLAMKDVNKMSAAERATLPKALGANAPETFEGFRDISTTLLDDLKGRSSVSKTYITDALKRPGISKAEKDAFTSALDSVSGEKVNVKDFADAVKTQLLPLERTEKAPGGGGRYESVSLPDDIRGPVTEYNEHIYNSPIKTSAGNVHFSREAGSENYFAHSRVEDLAKQAEWGSTSGNGDTRRIIEIQSDLFQKGNLDNESLGYKNVDEYNKEYPDQNFGEVDRATISQVQKLRPYENTWQDRVIREEVKQAALDGKTKLQFPTGETALRIEGLAGDNGHVPVGAQVGDTFEYGGETYRIIDEYGTNEVSAIPDAAIEREFNWKDARDEEIENAYSNFISEAEDGDISRFVEPSTNFGGKWLSKEFQKGFEEAKKQADEAGSGEAVVNYLYDHEDEIRTVAENEIKSQYSNAKEMAEYFNDNLEPGYFAQGDNILYTGENGVSEETMQRGAGGLDIDTDHPIYKFYEGDVRKFLQKKYNAEKVEDNQGVTWYEVKVPKEAANEPVKAFGKAQLGPLIGLGAASAVGAGALAARPQPLQK